ncbi:DUF4193 family protein [Kocuria sp. NPDC057446]|uniref:DUF4193 family protein n=1 Tax=Kocuria sp. NPDC057446 TaxID=3346137 RepID=UPI0036BE2A79
MLVSSSVAGPQAPARRRRRLWRDGAALWSLGTGASCLVPPRSRRTPAHHGHRRRLCARPGRGRAGQRVSGRVPGPGQWGHLDRGHRHRGRRPCRGHRPDRADLSHEELTVTVIPEQVDAFICASCFLVRRCSQLAHQAGETGYCTDCKA